MANRIQVRRDTAANWTSANPVLAAGEPALETDTGRRKTGDGTTVWTALPYVFDKTIADGIYTTPAAADAAYAPITGSTNYLAPGQLDAANAANITTPTTATAGALNAAYASTGAIARSPAVKPPPQPIKTLITSFQSGHGWTTTNQGAGTDLNDVTDIGIGYQSVKFVTTTTNASGTVISPVLSTIDMTAKNFKILLKVEGLANVTDLRFYAGDSTFANAKNINLLPIEVGGSDFNYIKENEWIWITTDFDLGSNIGVPNRAAITKMQFRFQAVNGAAATLHIGAVAASPYSSAFPNGAVSFTYDDGRITGLSYGRGALDKYGWAGTSFLIRDKIATVTGGSYATLDQLKAAREHSGWEIGCHADLAADHDAGFSTLTPQQVQADLLAERQWLYDNGLGVAEGFAWPRGMSTKIVEDAASKIVSYGRGNFTTQARETFPPAVPMRIRAYNVGASTTLATLQSWVDITCVQDKGWLVLTFHEIVATGAAPPLQVNQAVHDGIIDYIAGLTSRPAVLPMIEVMRKAT